MKYSAVNGEVSPSKTQSGVFLAGTDAGAARHAPAIAIAANMYNDLDPVIRSIVFKAHRVVAKQMSSAQINHARQIGCAWRALFSLAAR